MANYTETFTFTANPLHVNANWDQIHNDWRAAGTNAWSSTNRAYTACRYHSPMDGDDHSAEFALVNTNTRSQVGVCVRASDLAITYYGFSGNPNGCELYKYVAGSYTQLDTGNGLTYGNRYKLEVEGSILRVYEDDGGGFDLFTSIGTGGELTDTDIPSGLYTGVAGYGGLSARLDDWSADDIVGGGIILIVQDSLHDHLSDQVDLIQVHTIFVNESLHDHLADAPVLVEHLTLVIAESLHDHLADEPVLVEHLILVVAESLHDHLVDNVDLTQAHSLTIADSLHDHLVDNVNLTQAHNLVPEDSLHDHLADNITLDVAAGQLLVVQDALHDHLADNVDLTQVHNLISEDSLHDHLVDSPVLTQKHTLSVQDALHDHLVDNIVLVAEGTLTMQDGLHDHLVDNVLLTQAHTLIVNDSLHDHLVDNIDLVEHETLAVQESLHDHVSDGIDLIQAHILAINDTFHDHLGEGDLILIQSGGVVLLVVQNVLHDHVVDSIDLIQDYQLSLEDSLHAHSVDNILLLLVLLKAVTMIGKFGTGISVNIKIYDLDDDSLIVDDDAMVEVSTTGYFKYRFEGYVDPTKEFLYIMVGGGIEQSGKIIYTQNEFIGQINSLPPSSVENANKVWTEIAEGAESTKDTLIDARKKAKLAAFKE